MTLMTTKMYRSIGHMTMYHVFKLQASCSNGFYYILQNFSQVSVSWVSPPVVNWTTLTSSYQLISSLGDDKAKLLKILKLHTQIMILDEVEAPFQEIPKCWLKWFHLHVMHESNIECPYMVIAT